MFLNVFWENNAFIISCGFLKLKNKDWLVV